MGCFPCPPDRVARRGNVAGEPTPTAAVPTDRNARRAREGSVPTCRDMCAPAPPGSRRNPPGSRALKKDDWPMGLLDGRHAVVAGAASPRGLGKAMAKLFAEHGATAAILDLDADAARTAARDLGEGLGLACDVTDPDTCRDASSQASSTAGARSTSWSTMRASRSRSRSWRSSRRTTTRCSTSTCAARSTARRPSFRIFASEGRLRHLHVVHRPSVEAAFSADHTTRRQRPASSA